MGPASCGGKRGAPLQYYSMDKQNNASSVRSGVSVQNGRNRIYRKATKLVRLKKLDSDSSPDTTDPFDHRELKTPLVHFQGLT
jgi:hypothetical protein